MPLIKNTILYLIHVMMILVTVLLIASVIYYLMDFQFSTSLLLLGLMTLAIGYYEVSKTHPGLQMPLFLGRGPMDSNTTAVLNTDVLMDEREVNSNLDQRSIGSKGEGLIAFFSHSALEYGLAGMIIVISAFSIYVNASIDYRMTDVMGDTNGFAMDQFPWQMTIDDFYNETGYLEEDTIASLEGMEEVKREGMYPLVYADVPLDLLAGFEEERLVEVGYILINQDSDIILSVSNQLYKAFEKKLPEPLDGRLDMLLELPETNNVSKSVSWRGNDGSHLTVSVTRSRPNYILKVIASAPE